MSPRKRALIVVDMLNDFLSPEGTLYLGQPGRDIIPAVRELILDARARKDPVIFARDSHRPDDLEFRMFPPHCVESTDGASLIPELAMQDGDYSVTKRRYDAFFGTELDLILREEGIDQLDLCGVCTNICILYTAACARNLAYEVNVHENAVAGTSAHAHEWALSEMENTLGCRRA